MGLCIRKSRNLTKNENYYYFLRHTNIQNSRTGHISYEVEYFEIDFHIENCGLVEENSKGEILGYIAIEKINYKLRSSMP